MGNSSLVSYTKLSPNNSGKRTHAIDRITPHCVVGQLSVETLGSLFAKSSYQASCNYAIGSDGRVALIVDEGVRSWCSSSNANDQRAVTIECASDKSAPYAFNTAVYNKLVDLCVDICKRNSKTKLLWISDKTKALAYEPRPGEMLLTVHRWFAAKSCPGDWLMERMGSLATTVTAKLAGSTSPMYYRVRRSWDDVSSQVGAYLQLENAKAEADKRGDAYAVFDWTGKEIYRSENKLVKEIRFYYPGYKRTGSPDDRQGAGCVWHDQNGRTLVVDAYVRGTEAGNKLIQYLLDKGLRSIDFVGTHAHGDHLGGAFEMLARGTITIENFYCYDTASLKLAGTGSANARSAKEDKEYLQKLVDQVKDEGGEVHFVKTGDTITCGEMLFEVNRHQPTSWSEYDTGEAWAYLNDGSICLYSRQLHMLMTGDASGEECLDDCGEIDVAEAGHHGNNGNRTSAKKFVAKGCKLAIECNNEKNGPGSCEFSRYGAGRLKEQGVEVWQLDDDICGSAKGGTLTVSQGGKTREFSVPFGKIFFRVRKSWADAASQIGAYTVLQKAQECADEHPGYYVFDESGTKIYPAEAVSEQDLFIGKIGAMAKADMAERGICAAITIAQAILESGWGKSELAANANNIFGMKKSLSGNTWPGSTWDGKSVYSKQTKEVYASGPATVQADFRAYRSWQESVGDHSAYLAGARNGSALRYAGLVGEADYKKAAQIIKAGGYATAPDYVDKLCRLVEQYDLTRFNTTYTDKPVPKVPYLVKVYKKIRIYKAPAGAYAGRDCPVGIFTIVQEQDGYGKLKSGAGWILLRDTTTP